MADQTQYKDAAESEQSTPQSQDKDGHSPGERNKENFQILQDVFGSLAPALAVYAQDLIEKFHKKVIKSMDEENTYTSKEKIKRLRQVVNEHHRGKASKPNIKMTEDEYLSIIYDEKSGPVELAKFYMSRQADSTTKKEWKNFDFSSLTNVLFVFKHDAEHETSKDFLERVKGLQDLRNEKIAHNITGVDPLMLSNEELKEGLTIIIKFLEHKNMDKFDVKDLVRLCNKQLHELDTPTFNPDSLEHYPLLLSRLVCKQEYWRYCLSKTRACSIDEVIEEEPINCDSPPGSVVALVDAKWVLATCHTLKKADDMGVVYPNGLIRAGILKVKVCRSVKFGHVLYLGNELGTLVNKEVCGDSRPQLGMCLQAPSSDDKALCFISCFGRIHAAEHTKATVQKIAEGLMDKMMTFENETVHIKESDFEPTSKDCALDGVYCQNYHFLCELGKVVLIKNDDESIELGIRLKDLSNKIEAKAKPDEDIERPQKLYCTSCNESVGATGMKKERNDDIEIGLFKRKEVQLTNHGVLFSESSKWKDIVSNEDFKDDINTVKLGKRDFGEKFKDVDYIAEGHRDNPIGELTFKPREDQLRLAEKVHESGNALLVMRTGMGKTYVAALVMHSVFKDNPDGIVLFLAPTTSLVYQQSHKLHEFFNNKRSVLMASSKEFEILKGEDILQVSIIVTTPMMFVMCERETRKKIARQLALVVMDEAHHAKSAKSPYGKVCKTLKELRSIRTSKNCTWRNLALSATPASNAQSCEQEVSLLCGRLSDDHMTVVVQQDKFETSLTREELFKSCHQETEIKVMEKLKQSDNKTALELSDEIDWIGLEYFLSMPGNDDRLSKAGFLHMANLFFTEKKWLGGKIQKVMDYLLENKTGDKFSRTIIYLQEKAKAKNLSKILEDISKDFPDKLGDLKSSWVAGGSELKKNELNNRINKFKDGDLSLLVSTPVLEEGIDVPDCDTVVFLTSPATVLAAVQRKGRARSRNSTLILFDEKDQQLLKEEPKIYEKLQKMSIKPVNQA